jgi:hypothetical protein
VKTDRRFLASACRAACLAAALAAPAHAERTVTVPTWIPPGRLHILLAGDPGGLAVDAAGNRYFSARNDNSVSMIRRREPGEPPPPDGEERAIVILDEQIRPGSFVQPGDVELSPDGRALIVTDGGGRVVAIPFGLTIELLDEVGEPRSDCTLRVQTDAAGTSPPIRFHRGFYTAPGVMSLAAGADSQTVRVLAECGSSRPRAFDVGLGQREGLFGQTFVRLVVP